MGLILIMTDSERGHPEIYRTLSLKDETVEVHAFKEAHDLVKDCMVDIILLDCNVDVDAGLKLLKENKTVCPHVPNIFLSNAKHEGVVLKAFRAGARDFFWKPLDIQELRTTIKGLLKVKRSPQENRSPFIKGDA